MEFGSIEREIQIDASPEVVFEVLTATEHIEQWWETSEVVLDPSPGGAGELVWGERSNPDSNVAHLTVVDSVPPRLFSFRWTYPDGAVPGPGNSLLVTFVIEPTATGSVLKLTETGFREKGWEVAVLEQHYRENVEGWDRFVPRIAEHATKVAASR